MRLYRECYRAPSGKAISSVGLGLLLAVAILTCSPPGLAGQGAPEVAAARDFDLVGGTVGPLHYYYERSLAGVSNELQSAFQDLLAKERDWERRTEEWQARAAPLISEADAAIGIDTNAPIFAEQKRLFIEATRLRTSGPVSARPICILTGANLARKGLAGAHLPGLTLKAKEGGLNFDADYNLYESPLLIIPVSGPERGVQDTVGFLESFFLPENRGLSLREAINAGIEKRLHPRRPFLRWFSFGFATAIAEQLLKREAPAAEKTAFAEYGDPTKFIAMRMQINLRYWLGQAYSVGVPSAASRQLLLARQAHATKIAREVLQEAGMDSVRAAIAFLAQSAEGTGLIELETRLGTLVKRNVRTTLDGYQTFTSIEDGIQQYTEEFRKARQEGNRELALFLWERLIELQSARDRQYVPDAYVKMAHLFEESGLTNAAIGLFSKQIATTTADQGLYDREVLQHEFVKFAWRTANLAVVFPVAEEMLREDPADAAAASVQLFRQVRGGELQRAKETAAMIVRDSEADEFFRAKAQAVLDNRIADFPGR
jgi:hypothetical protein